MRYNVPGYRQLAELGTRICRLSISSLVKLILFLLTLPLIGDEPLFYAGFLLRQLVVSY